MEENEGKRKEDGKKDGKVRGKGIHADFGQSVQRCDEMYKRTSQNSNCCREELTGEIFP